MPELGLFGKIPAKGDFVRYNVVDDAARSFEQWIQESNDALRGAGGELCEHTIRLVFTPPGSRKSVVAVLVPSQDKVGRKFPIVFFALAPVSDTRSHFSSLPFTWSPFLDAAAALGAQARTMEWEAVRSAVSSLPCPGPGDQTRTSEVCDKVLAHPLVGELHERLFGAREGMHYYAYQTFLTACGDAAKGDPGKPATVLDCPIRVDVDLFVWLELGRRAFGFPPAHPQVFWIEDPAPRLLLSLGPAGLNILQLLADPGMSHSRLWPLETDRDKAIDAAREALSDVLGPVDDSTPLGGMLEALGERARSGNLR